MNTSNSDFAQAASLPDIEQLTKLANELFAALPCDGSRIGIASSPVTGGLTSSLPGADKFEMPQGFGLPGEAELQKLLAPRQPSFDSVSDSIDTGSVFGNPSSAATSPLAGLDAAVLAGVLTHNFGLPDEAQLQQLLVSHVPSGSNIPGSVEAVSVPAAPSPSAGIEPLAKVAASPQAIEAQLQNLFAANTADKSGGQKASPKAPTFGARPTFDASLIAGLTPQAYGLPGEAELQKLFSPPGSIPTSAGSGSSFYFLDELKNGGFNTQAPTLASAHPAFDVQAVRRDFPILKERVNGRPLVWFDNAATTQKPQAVIDRVSYFYEHENSNIHRAAHELAARSTDAYEKARDTVAHFMNASSSAEIVFTRGTTEAINLVAQSWGRQHIGAGDEIVITWLEHHANRHLS